MPQLLAQIVKGSCSSIPRWQLGRGAGGRWGFPALLHFWRCFICFAKAIRINAFGRIGWLLVLISGAAVSFYRAPHHEHILLSLCKRPELNGKHHG